MSAAALKDTAATHFQAQQFDAARTCYERALQATDGAALVGTIFSNLAAAHLKGEDTDAALCCAAAAMSPVARTPAIKACVRAAQAL